LLKACGGRIDVDLERRKSSGLVFSDEGRLKGIREVGAHFRRNCKESNEELLVIASGFSATESTMGFKTVFMREFVSDSGSFSQSMRLESASGVEMVAGSLI
jgi:hypothetical protein